MGFQGFREETVLILVVLDAVSNRALKPLFQENNQDGKTLKQYLLSYRFFFVHSSMRLRACCRFSRELATLKRK
jgi:hypothetical protein